MCVKLYLREQAYLSNKASNGAVLLPDGSKSFTWALCKLRERKHKYINTFSHTTGVSLQVRFYFSLSLAVIFKFVIIHIWVIPVMQCLFNFNKPIRKINMFVLFLFGNICIKTGSGTSLIITFYWIIFRVELNNNNNKRSLINWYNYMKMHCIVGLIHLVLYMKISEIICYSIHSCTAFYQPLNTLSTLST